MKKLLSLILFLTVLLSSTTAFAAQPSPGFTDLPTDHWAYQAVMQMVDKDILEGFGDGTFRPDDPVTRAQFAKILVLSLGLPLDYSGQQTFIDIPSSDWSYQYVEAAQKYLTGYKNQQDGQLYFKGDEVAVREDMAVAVVMAKGLNTQNADLTVLNQFSDISSMSQSLRKYIAVAVANHIMDGYGNGLFGPQNTLTRAEAAELMYKSGILSGSDSGSDKVAVGNSGSITLDATAIAKIQSVKLSIVPQAIGNDKYVATVTLQKSSDAIVKVEGFSELYVASMDQYLKENDTQTIEDTNGTVKISGIIPAGLAYSKIRVKASIVSVSKGSFDENVVTSNELAINSEDSTAPTIVSTTPAGGATDVDVNAPIDIVYSRAIQEPDYNPSDINVTYNSGSNNFLTTVTTKVEGTNQNILRLAPNYGLRPSTTYTVKITADTVKDASGDPTTEPYTFSFTTKAEKEAELVHPNNFKASLTSDKKVLLSWDIVPNSNPNYNQGYTILRDDKFLTMIKDPSKDSYIDDTVETGKTYTYEICFYFGAFDSTLSNPVTISVGIDNTTPTVVSTTPADGAANVTGNNRDIMVSMQFSQNISISDNMGITIQYNNSDAHTFNNNSVKVIKLDDKSINFWIEISSGRKYTITLEANSVTNSAGISNQPYTFSFTTGN